MTQQHPLALLWTGAAACLAAALTLVFAAGLPDRAMYSGQILSNGQAVAPEIGALAPPFDAPTLTGTVAAADLRGAPLVINFWATWCIPCRIEMPELQALHAAHPDVRVLAVNLGESRHLIVDWAAQFGLTFDIVLDADQAIASLYRLRGQPSTYIVSPGGVITSIFYGPATQQTLEGALEPFLRES
ncbi:MAG: TlpA family protein disulfide reductase [Anaerolineae bacterium]|nr:TlpA family protein disulfide reductase [Anaerolineae bacterium]